MKSKAFKVFNIAEDGAAVVLARNGEGWKLRNHSLAIGDIIIANREGKFHWDFHLQGFSAERINPAPKNVVTQVWTDN